MPFLILPPPVAACDVAAAEAEVSRLEDQAFVAMKAATEKVALAARSGPIGSAGDAEWAEYKRLTAEVDRWRAEAIACRTRPVLAAAPAAEAPPPARLTAAAPTSADDGAPRFRIEASLFEADRQPTSAGRFRIDTRVGEVSSSTPNLPATPSFSTYTVASTREGPRQNVRSWATGFALAGEFAPAGLGADGWRFTSRIGSQLERTKSEAEPFLREYVATGPARNAPPCPWCSAYLVPATVEVAWYRSNATTRQLYSDTIKQTSRKLDLDFGAARDFTLPGPLDGLRASLGGELGVGWWTVEERELTIVGSSGDIRYETYGSSDGPVGRASLTGSVSAPAPWIEGLSWSVRSRIGYEVADLTSTQLSVNPGGLNSRSTIQNVSDGTIGSLGARLDYASGPFGGFVAVERRRDLSLASVRSAPSGLARSSKKFDDGSAVYVWPVYSSRLTVGVNYGF